METTHQSHFILAGYDQRPWAAISPMNQLGMKKGREGSESLEAVIDRSHLVNSAGLFQTAHFSI